MCNDLNACKVISFLAIISYGLDWIAESVRQIETVELSDFAADDKRTKGISLAFETISGSTCP